MSEAAAVGPAAGGAPEGGAQGGGAPAETSWTDGLGEQDLALIEKKQFGGPADLIQSYRNLESLAGTSEEYLVRIPKDDDPEAWGAVYNKLGRPESAEAYELPLPENADPDFAKWAAGTFHELGLTKTQAAKLTEGWNNYATKAMEDQATARHDAAEQEAELLQREWGKNHDAYMAEAKRAAQEFGFTGEEIDALEGVLGFGGLMKRMREIGRRMGEDTFADGGSRGDQGGSGGMSPAAARAQLEELQLDKSFMEAWMNAEHPGHAAAVARKQRLTRAAYPEG